MEDNQTGVQFTKEQQDNVRKLIAAFRSGEYKQTQGYLKINGRYCASGVACDVYAKDTGQGYWDYEGFVLFECFSRVMPPTAVEEYFGWFTVEAEEVRRIRQLRIPLSDKVLYSLMDLNDNFGFTFEDFAKLFEARLEASA